MKQLQLDLEIPSYNKPVANIQYISKITGKSFYYCKNEYTIKETGRTYFTFLDIARAREIKIGEEHFRKYFRPAK